MSLKLATVEDFEDIKRMALAFAEASPYKDFPREETKIEELILNLLRDRNKTIIILYLHEGNPVGMIAGMSSEMIFSRDLVTSEVIWWVDKEFRGSRKALALKEAYEYWAKRIGAKYIGMSNLDDPKISRYYERSGYKPYERAFMKVVE